MNLSLLFADGEVSAVIPTEEGIRIRFSAAHVLQIDVAGESRPLEGFARGVVIWLAGATWSEPPGDLIGRVSHGRVRVGGRWLTALPLPCSLAGPVTFELTLGNQSHFTVSAGDLECRFEDEPNVSESMAC